MPTAASASEISASRPTSVETKRERMTADDINSVIGCM
jgi:hypothetical protein